MSCRSQCEAASLCSHKYTSWLIVLKKLNATKPAPLAHLPLRSAVCKPQDAAKHRLPAHSSPNLPPPAPCCLQTPGLSKKQDCLPTTAPTCLPLRPAASRPQPLRQVRLLSQVVLHCVCVQRSEARDAADQLRPACVPILTCMPIGFLVQQALQNQAAGLLGQGRCCSALGSTGDPCSYSCTFASSCRGDAADYQEANTGLLLQPCCWPEFQQQVHLHPNMHVAFSCRSIAGRAGRC